MPMFRCSSLCWWVVLFGSGCGPGPIPSPPRGAGTEQRVAGPSSQVPLRLYEEVNPANWVDFRQRHQNPVEILGDPEIVAIGYGTALARTKAGYYVLRDPAGIVGPFNLPEGHVWVGFVGRTMTFAPQTLMARWYVR